MVFKLSLSEADSNVQKLKKLPWILLLISQFCFAYSGPEISILTCSSGDEVYSVFGHSAIRVMGEDTDVIYNFGMFDFETSNFTLKFISGRLKYHLGIQRTEDFISLYSTENRGISEQKLRLGSKEKKILMEKLNFLYKPENRFYSYSFLKKNCSTEIRDLLMEVGVEFTNGALEKTNRDLINQHLTRNPWLRFGTTLMLGKSLEQKSSRFESMFLPKFLKREIANATLNGKPLITSEIELNTVENSKKTGLHQWLSPFVLFSMLLVIYLFTKSKVLEYIFVLSAGTIGYILLLMWFFSAHPEVKNNLNVLWCSPLYLLCIPAFGNGRVKKILGYVLLGMILLTIIVWITGYQNFDIGMIPLLIILTVVNARSIYKIN